MDRDALLKFEDGRRDVIWALEGLALYSDLFRPSAKLLLSLAEAENETWSNNATGVFAGLFSLGYGQIAPTSLAPEHRLPILTAALKENERRAEIALTAFQTALAIRSITRWGNDQPFRLRQRVTRWTPETSGEWFGAFRLYWQTLKHSLSSLPPILREKGIGILLSRARELLTVETLRDEILDTLSSQTWTSVALFQPSKWFSATTKLVCRKTWCPGSPNFGMKWWVRRFTLSYSDT